jgi:hypothetical protein
LGWTLFYMVVILKIPVVGMAWIIWWAIKSQPVVEDGAPDEGGGQHPRPVPPRPPRRGPHAEPLPPAPQRVRTARARSVTRHP